MMTKSFLALAWLLPVAAFRSEVVSGVSKKTHLVQESEQKEQWLGHAGAIHVGQNRWGQTPAVRLGSHPEGPLIPAWGQTPAVRLGNDPEGPLIPALVPPAGETFLLQSKESFDFLESNEYRWEFVSRETVDGETIPVNTLFGTLGGSFFGNAVGKRRTTIKNNLGRPMFHIELAKSVVNPFRLHWSWRIRHPGSNHILFTINKDIMGAGVLWIKDEWRIYRGRKRHHNQIYHVVGGYMGYGHKFYKSKWDWRRGKAAVGEATQSVGESLLGLPNSFSVTVEENEDAALFLTTAVIIDMVHEAETTKKILAAQTTHKVHKWGHKKSGFHYRR